jgi:hypothetical protein
MTKRPDPFDQPLLEDALRAVGCPESFVSTTISNYRLFVPFLFSVLGEERVFQIICQARTEFGLGEQYSAWRSAVKYIVAWADNTLEDYRTRRGYEVVTPADNVQADQPRLL